MNTFKIGDKVKFIKSIGDCTLKQFTLNKVYTIIGGDKNSNFWFVEKDNGIQWYIINNCFKLAKDKPITEVDYLNCFQENFREGI